MPKEKSLNKAVFIANVSQFSRLDICFCNICKVISNKVSSLFPRLLLEFLKVSSIIFNLQKPPNSNLALVPLVIRSLASLANQNRVTKQPSRLF